MSGTWDDAPEEGGAPDLFSTADSQPYPQPRPQPLWLWEGHYYPHPDLLAIAKRHPEIEWLCYSSPADRRWWLNAGSGYALDLLIDRYPEVSEDEWARLFR